MTDQMKAKRKRVKKSPWTTEPEEIFSYTWVRNQKPVVETLRMMMKENIVDIIVNLRV